MSDKSRKPILPNVILATALVLMLAVGYVMSDCAAHWLCGRGVISDSTLDALGSTVFSPLDFHADRRLPGHKPLTRLRLYCYAKGLDSNATWEDAVYMWP